MIFKKGKDWGYFKKIIIFFPDGNQYYDGQKFFDLQMDINLHRNQMQTVWN